MLVSGHRHPHWLMVRGESSFGDLLVEGHEDPNVVTKALEGFGKGSADISKASDFGKRSNF